MTRKSPATNKLMQLR